MNLYFYLFMTIINSIEDSPLINSRNTTIPYKSLKKKNHK